jgi:D-alanine transfer protein
MSSSSPANRVARPHLAAALGALGFVVLAALGFDSWGQRAERAAFPALLPVFAEPAEHAETDRWSVAYVEHLKNQGIALQQRAFERTDILPLYGSSELVKPIPNKASLFFRNFPTGFFVLPVGKAGTTSLIMLQKVAALGDAVRGRRVAISVSPSWFFPAPDPDHAYRGNYSRQQTFAALVNPGLSFRLKRDFARSLLQHPGSVQREALLRFLVTHLARGGRVDRAAYAAAWPVARLNLALYAAQDHFETARFLRLHAAELGPPPEVIPEQVDWDRLIARPSPPSTPSAAPRELSPDKLRIGESYRESIEHGPAWQELELLLRALREMRVTTLVLCMPPNRVYLKRIGVSKESLDRFAARIRGIASHNGAQLEAFEIT